MAHAKLQTYTDENKVLLAGCSQGGLVSALVASEETDVRGLILLYPALSIPDDARKGKMMFTTFDPSAIPEKMNIGPMRIGRRYVTDVLNMKPYERIGSYRGKVLIIHGDKDRIVDISYSEKAFETYKEAGADVELRIIHGAGHIFIRRKYKNEAKAAITAFLGRIDKE